MAPSEHLMPRLWCLLVIRNIFLNCDMDLPWCRSNSWLLDLFTMVSGNRVLSFFVLKLCRCIPFPLFVFQQNSPTFLFSPYKLYYLDFWLFSLLSSEFFPIDPNLSWSADLQMDSVFPLRYDLGSVNWNYCSSQLLVILAWDYTKTNESLQNWNQRLSDNISN